MATTAFLAALDAAIPGSGAGARRIGGLEAYSFVTEVVAPAYLEAVAASPRGGPFDEARAAQLSAVVEAGFASGDDDLVDALAMRLVERYLCRDRALAERARPFLGPATLGILAKMERLIADADERVAESRAAGSQR